MPSIFSVGCGTFSEFWLWQHAKSKEQIGSYEIHLICLKSTLTLPHASLWIEKKTVKTARKQNFVTRTKFVIFLSFSRIVLCEFFQFYDGLTVGAFDNMHCRTFSACFISSKNRSIATRQSTDTNKLDHFEYLVVHKHKNKSKMNVAKKERVASNIIPFSFFLLMVWHFVIFH